METEVNTEKKENKALYWMITLVSAVACVGLLIYKPEWFWLTLPFLFTYFVKAVGMM
jgi:plastocyanin domain-containing protein